MAKQNFIEAAPLIEVVIYIASPSIKDVAFFIINSGISPISLLNKDIFYSLNLTSVTKKNKNSSSYSCIHIISWDDRFQVLISFIDKLVQFIYIFFIVGRHSLFLSHTIYEYCLHFSWICSFRNLGRLFLIVKEII